MSKNKTTIAICLTQKTIDLIKEKACEDDRSISSMIETILKQYFADKKGE